MTELLRRPAEQWAGIAEEATWTTHLNDLRFLASGATLGDWQRQLLHELKLLALFHGKRVVIADSDLNNNPAFQGIFLTDAHRVRSAFTSGRLVLAIRESAPDLASLNAQQGPVRADPTMFERAKPFALAFDTVYREAGLVALSWKLAASSDSFRDAVTSLHADTMSPVPPQDRELLASATEHALGRNPDGKLFFGNIYDRLVRDLNVPLTSPAVQAVRAAHMLNTCTRLGFVPSLPVGDVDPSYACFILRPDAGSAAPSEKYLSILPQRILTDAALDAIGFDELPELQAIGDSVAYFSALENCKRAWGSSQFEGAFLLYLVKLSEYLARLGQERHLELVEWQRELLQEQLNRTERNGILQRVFFYCTPVALLSSLVLLSVNILPLLGVAGLTISGGSLLADIRSQTKRAGLKAVLDGNSSIRAKKR